MKLHIILILTAALLAQSTGCSSVQSRLTGTWSSVSIENPDPLFKDTLPDRKIGAVAITFYPDKKFKWIDFRDKVEMKGIFSLEKNTLVLTHSKEAIPLLFSYSWGSNKLVLKTDDGFTFSFIRSDNRK